ncbi:MAG: FliM/FliN family flagellar motor switch protein [Spirochaetales bacterium]|nr:FliM/FliN family flagellar motor switch protein [Spirochaetales bacterium]
MNTRTKKTGDIKEIKVPLQVVLGETELSLEDLSRIDAGSIIQLKNYAGDPVDLFAAGEKVAKGEVVVIDEYFGIRVTSIVKEEE